MYYGIWFLKSILESVWECSLYRKRTRFQTIPQDVTVFSDGENDGTFEHRMKNILFFAFPACQVGE